VTFAEGLLQVDGPNNLATRNYAFYGQLDYMLTEQLSITLGGRYTHENKDFEGFQSDANGLNYKLAQAFGDPNCASLNPISNQCRIDNSFPNPGSRCAITWPACSTRRSATSRPRSASSTMPPTT
jgi:iron complex outermembrane receptor protein